MFQDSDFKEVGREDFIFLHRCQKVVQQFRLVSNGDEKEILDF